MVFTSRTLLNMVSASRRSPQGLLKRPTTVSARDAHPQSAPTPGLPSEDSLERVLSVNSAEIQGPVTYELRIMSYELRPTSYELRDMSYAE